jgi:1-acyl-sn-glycerol-3-phosphate acyltransferase
VVVYRQRDADQFFIDQNRLGLSGSAHVFGQPMIARLRVLGAILLVAIVTPFLALAQLVAMKTGWMSDAIFPPLWHKAVLKALGVRVRVVGAMSARRPLLLASNHISWADILVIGSLVDVRFIARADLAGWPIMGFLSKLQHTVFVERERKRKTGAQASEIAVDLAAGHAMVLFPEGTTADGNFILPFKSSLFGAAQLAIDEHTADSVFIQPLAIAYTRVNGIPLGRKHRARFSWAGGEGLWPSLRRFLHERAVDVELRFGEAVDFNAASKRKDVARVVEASVRAMFADALAGRAPEQSR